MSMLNRLKSGYYFALFNASNFGCTVINLLTMANYQNYHFYFTINYIYIYTQQLHYFVTVVVLISIFSNFVYNNQIDNYCSFYNLNLDI